ncbi:cupin domain-containing protein [Conexibacter sp. SYSU D00693]|uniref:cupin domain-containing protein n=1 Tax=Conexibacter sp. SYSU D00693 TaxID=2812560 RepID=UPI00196AED55|nr:cupin domain-containing protein [Conexibacter sp. SYSU D00693]
MATTYELTPHESVTVLESGDDALVVEATYGPGKPPPPHLHPSQDEHFAVLEGELQVKVEGQERTLRPGDTLEVPRGTVHAMWSTSGARVRWETRPPGRTQEWYATLDALQRDGRVAGNGMPGPLHMAVLLEEFSDVFRVAAGPAPVVGAALKGLALAGRLRGHAA